MVLPAESLGIYILYSDRVNSAHQTRPSQEFLPLQAKFKTASILGQICSAERSVARHAVYVHDLILEKLEDLENTRSTLDGRWGLLAGRVTRIPLSVELGGNT